MAPILRPAFAIFVAFTLIAGGVYPVVITVLGQAFFPRESNGSLIVRDGKVVGSSLIGQEFSDPKLFWGRLSATSPVPYTAYNADLSTGSSGSNLGPVNPALIEAARARIDALNAADTAVGIHRPSDTVIPVDLVTSSGSGLDPHISLAAADYQIARIAKSREISEERVRALVRDHTRQRDLGVLGEPVVNVVELNLALGEVSR